MRHFILVVIYILIPTTIYCQPDFSQLARDKISDLNMMVGTWEGTGYFNTSSGKESSQVTERVQYRLDKTVLEIEGRGVKLLDDGTELIVHDALGIISFHPFRQEYLMHAFTAKGVSTEAQLQILDSEQIIWFIEAGPMTIRYTLSIREGLWTEIGERSSDGENWQQFFSMELKKVN